MVFLELVEIGFTIVCLTVIVSQIIIPIILGKSLFPLFKKQTKDVDRKITKIKDELDVVEKEQERVDYLEQLTKERKELQSKIDRIYNKNEKES
jgi:uncharacterized protein HemX